MRTAFANRLAVEIEEMIPDEFFGFHALALTVPDSVLTGGGIRHESSKLGKHRSLITTSIDF